MSAPAAGYTPITTPWPEGFPADAACVSGFAVREVAAPAEAVYRWLLRPDLHAEFYAPLRGVRRAAGSWPELSVGTRHVFFVGPLFVPPVRVVQADPSRLSLAWAMDVPGFKACHAFTAKAIDAERSLVRSEEKWAGLLARAIAPFSRAALQAAQTGWTEAIVRAATRYPAGPPEH